MHIDVQHLATLSRLSVSEIEREKYERQIGSILEYLSKLGEVDTTDVPELAHPAVLENVWAEDEIHERSSEQRNAMIEAFPNRAGDLLSVPAVFEE